jgi:hypothetical protein
VVEEDLLHQVVSGQPVIHPEVQAAGLEVEFPLLVPALDRGGLDPLLETPVEVVHQQVDSHQGEVAVEQGVPVRLPPYPDLLAQGRMGVLVAQVLLFLLQEVLFYMAEVAEEVLYKVIQHFVV